MKRNLLAITQEILSEMDSDEVNNIDDTIEAQQVAAIVRSCYFELIANRNWPHLRRLTQLDALNDITRPTYLRLPEGTKELISFHYYKHKLNGAEPNQQEVRYLYPDEFLRYTAARNFNMDHVTRILDTSGTTLLIINNQAPNYWTSFDDEHIVCDSYDASVDDTLKQGKTQVLLYRDPVWDHTNTFIPDLPSEAFPALIEEAKSTAFVTLKQTVNQKAEQKAARQQRWLSRKAWSAAGGVRYPNYGRRGRR